MTQAGLAHFADALVFVHGPKAFSEAARHAELCERTGDQETADRWRRTMTLVKDHAPQAAKQKLKRAA